MKKMRMQNAALVFGFVKRMRERCADILAILKTQYAAIQPVLIMRLNRKGPANLMRLGLFYLLALRCYCYHCQCHKE